MEPNWLEWARKLNALAQTGLTFAENPYDIERYTTIRTIAAEMIAHGSGGDTSRVLDLFACDAGYATPKVDVRGVVFQDGKLLLVQERSDGMWTLPGGWADVGDSPADAVVREIREESGYETRATKLLALLDRNRLDLTDKRLFQKPGEVPVFQGFSRPGPIFETVSKAVDGLVRSWLPGVDHIRS